METLTYDEMLKRLEDAAKEAGSQRALARKLGVKEPYLSDVMNGRRDIGQRLARAMGYERVQRFVGTGEEVFKPCN